MTRINMQFTSACKETNLESGKKIRKETKRKEQEIFFKGCLHRVKNPRASPI
jgi:hypothetical protein